MGCKNAQYDETRARRNKANVKGELAPWLLFFCSIFSATLPTIPTIFLYAILDLEVVEDKIPQSLMPI